MLLASSRRSYPMIVSEQAWQIFSNYLLNVVHFTISLLWARTCFNCNFVLFIPVCCPAVSAWVRQLARIKFKYSGLELCHHRVESHSMIPHSATSKRWCKNYPGDVRIERARWLDHHLYSGQTRYPCVKRILSDEWGTFEDMLYPVSTWVEISCIEY